MKPCIGQKGCGQSEFLYFAINGLTIVEIAPMDDSVRIRVPYSREHCQLEVDINGLWPCYQPRCRKLDLEVSVHEAFCSYKCNHSKFFMHDIVPLPLNTGAFVNLQVLPLQIVENFADAIGKVADY